MTSRQGYCDTCKGEHGVHHAQCAANKQVFTVHSSHGDLECDPITGNVLKVVGETTDSEPGYLQNIIQVDLAEYRQWARNSTSPEWEHDTETDILLLGYWTKDGVHELPCEDFRDACLAEAHHNG